MLAESPISLDRVAWSGQTGRPAAASRDHDRDRGRGHLRQTQIVACANNDPSSWPPRNDALGNRSRPPGVWNLSQRAGLKPIRHGPGHWTRSRCGQPKSLTRSLAGCGSPLNDQLTPKALFHQASLRSDRLVRPHGVMSSVWATPIPHPTGRVVAIRACYAWEIICISFTRVYTAVTECTEVCS